MCTRVSGYFCLTGAYTYSVVAKQSLYSSLKRLSSPLTLMQDNDALSERVSVHVEYVNVLKDNRE